MDIAPFRSELVLPPPAACRFCHILPVLVFFNSYRERELFTRILLSGGKPMLMWPKACNHAITDSLEKACSNMQSIRFNLLSHQEFFWKGERCMTGNTIDRVSTEDESKIFQALDKGIDDMEAGRITPHKDAMKLLIQQYKNNVQASRN